MTFGAFVLQVPHDLRNLIFEFQPEIQVEVQVSIR